MDTISYCKTCGAEEESIFHAFFECTWARLFWKDLKKIASINIPLLHPRSWATDLVEGKIVSLEIVCVILCGCWAVWQERNAVWHDEHGRSVTALVRWALETTYDLAQLGRKKVSTQPKQVARWVKPASDVVKINVDASFFEDDHMGATGLVVRDSFGALILAQARWMEHAANPLVMEALAILAGVHLAIDRGYQKVEVETDAKEVIKLIDDPGGGRSCIASIRQEIEELRGYFTSFKICFIGRQANMAAHLCARKATRFRRRCLWINYDPPFLSETLAKDCNSCETF
jgi:ribonuclease HI